ncbi:lysylphosphatidylglycerol synthase transmembrane domain-containing protein [Actinomycetes bacterium KLBMP 9797]
MNRRVLLALLPPVAVVCYAVWKWPSLVSAGRALTGADPRWLALGAVAIALTYVAGAASQQGALAVRLPRGRLFGAQLAGVCANAFLPAGLGAALVGHRFLRCCGVSGARAATAVTLNAAAGAAINLTVLLSLCLIAPDRLPVRRPELGTVPVLVGSAAVLAVAGCVAGVLASGRGRAFLVRARDQVVAQAVAVPATLADRRQALLLWGGSAASPLLHTVTLAAVLHAVGRPLPVLDVLVAYFAASAVAAIVPSPGSVGSLDIVLGLTLVGVGADPGTAVTAVLGYRLLSTWLPLLPSALALAHLRGTSPATPAPAPTPSRTHDQGVPHVVLATTGTP